MKELLIAHLPPVNVLELSIPLALISL